MPDDPRFHPVNIINDKDALHSVTWDYKAIETLDAPTLSDERNLCVNDVRAIAEKYNVGFMVGEFGGDF